jgi:hypothetical protein
MKLRCYACKGPFGLARRYFRGRAFCCRRCEDAWKFGLSKGSTGESKTDLGSAGDFIAALSYP